VSNNPVDSEDKEISSEDGRESIKMWFQENLRMIISVAIVLVIAGGIYSYSKRTQAPVVKRGAEVASNESEGKISVVGGETEEVSEETAAQNVGKTEEPVSGTEKSVTEEKPVVASAETSKETEVSFQETAAKGDSTTKLARRALANYLEKNADSTLTAEHKVYIEDYLRRQVSNGRLKVGETKEFSKDMIAKAIEKSKGLNENQLKNLQKYSQKVSGLK
jgi:carboxypeptidase C (cathepsin A)